jgi:putative glutamine amidotransferase
MNTPTPAQRRSPTIGITVDNKNNTAQSGTYECATAYCIAVNKAGGTPILLPHQADRIEQYLAICDGFILTGGVDPQTEHFNQPMHENARPMDPNRQAFELALLDALDQKSNYHKALLGVCLGMQLMTLRAGGTLNQYLPDTLDNPEYHQKNNRHTVNITADDSVLTRGVSANDISQTTVASFHQQAMQTAGNLRVIAQADDGVIEAVDSPERKFYVGVQWHPERGGNGALNQSLIDELVEACNL